MQGSIKGPWDHDLNHPGALGLNYFEEPWLKKADSENAAKEKVGSVSEQISFVEKTLPL